MAEIALTETALTIDEAAAFLRVSRRTIDRLQADGMLTPHYRVSLRGHRTRLFLLSDVKALSERQSA